MVEGEETGELIVLDPLSCSMMMLFGDIFNGIYLVIDDALRIPRAVAHDIADALDEIATAWHSGT